jgi:hypothetical protein
VRPSARFCCSLGSIFLCASTSLANAQSSLDSYFFPPPGVDQRGTVQQRIDQLQARRAVLENNIRIEQQRVIHYLTLLDHIYVIKQVLASGAPANPQQALASVRQHLYYNSFDDNQWRSLVADHQNWVNQYLVRVEQYAMQSGSWPAGRSAAEWQALSRQELESIRQRYFQRIAQGNDPTPELRHATQVLAWAQGFSVLTPTLDYFGAAPQRATTLVAQIPR